MSYYIQLFCFKIWVAYKNHRNGSNTYDFKTDFSAFIYIPNSPEYLFFFKARKMFILKKI